MTKNEEITNLKMAIPILAKERLQNLVEYRSKNLSYMDMAKILGLTKQRIYQIFRENGPNIKQDLYRLVLERDKNQCIRCGSKNNIFIKHLNKEKSKFNNLMTICFDCYKNIIK